MRTVATLVVSRMTGPEKETRDGKEAMGGVPGKPPLLKMHSMGGLSPTLHCTHKTILHSLEMQKYLFWFPSLFLEILFWFIKHRNSQH